MLLNNLVVAAGKQGKKGIHRKGSVITVPFITKWVIKRLSPFTSVHIAVVPYVAQRLGYEEKLRNETGDVQLIMPVIHHKFNNAQKYADKLLTLGKKLANNDIDNIFALPIHCPMNITQDNNILFKNMINALNATQLAYILSKITIGIDAELHQLLKMKGVANPKDSLENFKDNLGDFRKIQQTAIENVVANNMELHNINTLFLSKTNKKVLGLMNYSFAEHDSAVELLNTGIYNNQ